MSLVIGGESLIGQKTGIGFYTQQLSQHLALLIKPESIEFLIHGRLIDFEKFQKITESENDRAGLIGSGFSKLKGVAAKQRFAVRIYSALTSMMEKNAFRKHGETDIFHSPNYFLPSFPGKRVVTILDLSTRQHPQFHPRARVELVNRHIEKVVRDADHIITISDFIKSEILELGVPSHRITRTYLGAADEFKPIQSQEFVGATTRLGLRFKEYFLCVSTIEPRKNLHRLLDAYDIYRSAVGGNFLPLVVVGHRGWNSDKIHARLERVSADGCIKYLGYLQQRTLTALFAGARALIFPSLYEGFGLPVLEAMKSGTAVLTSSNSAMEEIAGDAALYANPCETGQLAEYIKELAEDNQLVSNLQAEGLSRSTAFSWDRCARETLNVYEKLASFPE